MARLGSRAVAGYFPAPVEIVDAVAGLLDLGPGDHAFLDPCAGDGKFAFELVKRLPAVDDVYLCEMEETRYQTMSRLRFNHPGVKATFNVAHGDAFALDADGCATVLYANPPYDDDVADGRSTRLEDRWLRRFGPRVAAGGALLFLVPHRALAASVDTLGREWDQVACYRLPDPLFDAFKQVLLVARRRATVLSAAPDDVAARVRSWADDPSTMPVLAAGCGPAVRVAGHAGDADDHVGFTPWTCLALDVAGVVGAVRPWASTSRAGDGVTVPGVVPSGPFLDLIARAYPVATPPRPPHIAAGIAAGAYNGAALTSATPGLPDVLVKGSFAKAFQCVEEKFNQDGDKTGEVQVQQPRLTITVLDATAGAYVELKGSVAATPGDAAPPLAEFTVGDLIRHYGPSLMATLHRQCPALHDPSRDDAPQPAGIRRTLFRAQRHALAAVVKLLRGPNRAALVLGELGVGKSTIAVAAAHAFGARRTLVFCPPHLAHKSWPDQVRSCLGDGARVAVLDSIEAVDRLAADDDPSPVVAVLSRESAKLGHAWSGVGADWSSGAPWASQDWVRRKAMRPLATCPACGGGVPRDEKTSKPHPPDVLARRRMRCENERRVPLIPDDPRAPTPDEVESGSRARWTIALAAAAARMAHDDDVVREFAPRMVRAMCGVWDHRVKAGKAPAPTWDVVRVRPVLLSMAASVRRRMVAEAHGPIPSDFQLYLALMHAADAPRVAAADALRLYRASRGSPDEGVGRGAGLREAARTTLILADRADQDRVADACKRMVATTGVPRYGQSWADWASRRAGEFGFWAGGTHIAVKDGRGRVGDTDAGTREAFMAALAAVAAGAGWTKLPPCGEPLFQAVPEPRRYPLAHYIRQRYPHLFDFLILDEAHEASTNANSAQALAAAQLVNLGLPTVALTGSVMNGYASSLFALLWSLSRGFREEFDREDQTRFVKECGYLKRFVEITKDGTEKEVQFGAQTDLRDGGKVVGQAPGVMPSLLLRSLLPVAVPIQLADLEDELPPKREIVVVVPQNRDDDLAWRYKRVESAIRDRIKKDRFVKGRAGKLFGAMAELVSMPDRASWDTGNAGATRPNAWETRYPDGELVAACQAFPVDHLLPKERWLVRTCWEERAEDRRVLVFVWHDTLMARIARILAELTEEPVAVLDSRKVAPRVREAWIDREVIAKGVPFLVVNPVAVSTGLNNLVWFHSEVFYESPACNPTIRRQACGRIRRIGQTREARFYTPILDETIQPLANQLLLLKQAIGEAVDGLNPDASLAAAGVGDGDAMAGREVGAALFDMLSRLEKGSTVGQGAHP